MNENNVERTKYEKQLIGNVEWADTLLQQLPLSRIPADSLTRAILLDIAGSLDSIARSLAQS
jgi:hypothetical protein